MGGMNKIVEAMLSIAHEYGVKILLNQEVKKIEVVSKKATRVHTLTNIFNADAVVAGSDYRHTEQTLLSKEYRTYSADYWEKRTMSPSSLLFYIGVDKKLPNLLHHNLFFDADFEQHAQEIYRTPQWPKEPLFYVCVPSKTDATVAPQGMENLFLLMPLAPGLEDSETAREQYFQVMMKRLQDRIGEPFEKNIVVKRSYCLLDFEKDYNSFKGNAYGLANTLMQTAVFKPKMISPKVNNLFYTGQLTVPGPGVPPSLISGEMVAKAVLKKINAGTI
jgi:phytoene desaturase